MNPQVNPITITHHTKEVIGHVKHVQKSMEESNLGHVDASIHLSLLVAEFSCSLEAMRIDAVATLEAASKNAKIDMVRKMAFPITTESRSRAIGNLRIQVGMRMIVRM